MKFPRTPALVLASAALVFSAQAVADHNSKNGEGWANMPNDIHNTRIETRESGDNEAFKDFVQHGDGADSVNRFDDGTPPGNGKMQQAKAVDESADALKSQTRQKDQTQQRDQIRQQDRIHQDTALAQGGDQLKARQMQQAQQSSRVRQSVGAAAGGRGQSGARQGGGRGGR